MTAFNEDTTPSSDDASVNLTRRDLLKGGGALLVAFSVPAYLRPATAAAAGATAPGGAFPLVGHPQLDNWIAVHQDGTVTVSIAKADIGTHMQTGLLQIAAEELDVPFESIHILTGDTARTPDLGTSSSSAGIAVGGPPVRAAAATARHALLQMAATRLGVPVDQLTVQDGVVSVMGSPRKRVSYAQLIGGQRFNLTMRSQTVQTQEGPVTVYGKAKPKSPSAYTIVGKSMPKLFIREKVTGEHEYVHDVKVAGMVHARPVRPPTIGARLLHVDKASVQHIAGLVDVIVKKDYVAVVAETEWAAIQAAQQLTVTWSQWSGLPTMEELYAVMRTVPHIDQVANKVGHVDTALAHAATVITATYESPYQVHGPIGPACAVADVRGDQATVWSGTQNIFGMRAVVAHLLGLPEQNVRFISRSTPGTFGESGADDCAVDAALISQAVGRPVRVQLTRQDEHGWDPGCSARVTDLRGGLDAHGHVVAWDLQTWTADNGGRPYGDAYAVDGLMVAYVFPNKKNPGTSMISAILAGLAPEFDVEGIGSADGGDSGYTFANERQVLHYLGKGSPRAEPLDGQPHAAPAGALRIRTGSERGVGSTPATFATESFIDELAAAAGFDPIEYRMRYLDPRNVALLKALATRAGWQHRPSPGPRATSAAVIVRGRGMAISPLGFEGGAAEVFEVEVNRKTGQVRVLRVVVAIDAGLIINPDAVMQMAQGGVIFGMSRALKEERRFDRSKITSVDWDTYPIITFSEVPQEIDVLLLDRPDQAPAGMGEPPSIPVAAGIANAIFDATGVRVRRQPFTPERVLAALKHAGKAV